MGNNKIIGNKIKSIRESKQLTIDEVAERSGLKKEQIERIESDIDFPSLAPLIKIARVLGVRLGTFLDDQTELGPVVNRKKDSYENNSIDFTKSWVLSLTARKTVTRTTVSTLPITRQPRTSSWNITRWRKTSRAVTWSLS